MHPRACLAAALMILCPEPAQANALIFSVTNDTASRWRLVDTTRNPGGAAYRIRPLPLGPGSSRAWLLEPHATLTFLAEADPGFVGLIGIGLGREDPAQPLLKTELKLPVPHVSVARASQVAGVADGANRFMVMEGGKEGALFALLSLPEPDRNEGMRRTPLVLPHMVAGQSPATASDLKRPREAAARDEDGAAAAPERSHKRQTVAPVPGGVSAAAANAVVDAASGACRLLLLNRSPKTWTLAVEANAPVPSARTWSHAAGRPASERTIRPRVTMVHNRSTYNYLIQPGSAFELPSSAPAAGGSVGFACKKARIVDPKGLNPFGARIEFLEGGRGVEGEAPYLLFRRKAGFVPPDNPVRMRGNTLEILGEEWMAPLPGPGRVEGSPVLGTPTPTPPPMPSSPSFSEASLGSSPLSSPLTLPGPAKLPSVLHSPPAPPLAARPVPAKAPATSPTPATLQGPPPPAADLLEGSGVPWTPQLRGALVWDLEHSPMFLGVDESNILAREIGLGTDIFIPLVDRAGHGLPDALGRTLIGSHARIGAGSPPDGHPLGRLLLHIGQHYTLLEPAPPGAMPRFATRDGAAYVEIATQKIEPGRVLDVPVIPSDGHCLLASMHVLKHGTLPSPDQIRHYRRAVARDLPPAVLRTLAGDLARDLLQQARPVLPSGCFSGLGPAFSFALQNDPAFMARYQAANALKALEEAFLLRSLFPDADPGSGTLSTPSNG